MNTNFVKFGDNEKEYPTLWVESGHSFIDGIDRQTLAIQLPADAEELTKINEMMGSPACTGHIEVSSQNTGTPGRVAVEVFDNYVLKQRVAVEQFQAGFDNATGAVLLEERLVIQLARKSMQEMQQEEILAKQAKIEAALAAMGITL